MSQVFEKPLECGGVGCLSDVILVDASSFFMTYESSKKKKS